jgi:hypothetical protein
VGVGDGQPPSGSRSVQGGHGGGGFPRLRPRHGRRTFPWRWIRAGRTRP